MSNRPSLSRVRPAVAALRDSLVATRRDLHRHPELSWQEHRTQGVILEQLTVLGLADVRSVGGTGASATVEGDSPSPCVLWRADIDALPIPEESGLDFASQEPGVMHACGHDAHAAIALGIASMVQARRASLHGSVRFVFQPAEEAAGGAEACLADGVLDGPRVDRVLGLHVSADIPLGTINVAPGPFFAAPTYLKIEILGQGGHAAAPHQSVDAVVVAAHIITALQSVVSRSVAPADTGVLTIGTVKSGYRWNVIAGKATLTGTIRTYTDRLREQMLERTETVVAGVCVAFGASYTFEHRTSCPPVVNDPAVTALVQREADGFFGPSNILASPSMGADDISEFLLLRPGCYFWLGARNEPLGVAGRHHDSGFMIDEDALPLGVEFGLRVIEAALVS